MKKHLALIAVFVTISQLSGCVVAPLGNGGSRGGDPRYTVFVPNQNPICRIELGFKLVRDQYREPAYCERYVEKGSLLVRQKMRLYQ